ncbi:MAG: hypothetical protein HC813_03875 [Planctomycetes bacterium]|nr:hypothetical protein [Planctomycetota bacterium]
MAAFAEPLEPLFHDLQEEWWFQGIGLAILAMVVLVLVLLGRRLSRAAEAHAGAQGTEGDPSGTESNR